MTYVLVRTDQPTRRVGPSIALTRIIIVFKEPRLTQLEFAALQEIGKGSFHATIPTAEAMRLLELKLAYRLLGEVRITTEGRKRLQADR